MSFILQILENTESQIVLDYIKYAFLLICFVVASIVMILIPIILFYLMIGDFMNMKEHNKKMNEEISFEEDHPEYLISISEKYHKASSKFFKNFTALLTWNVFSLSYIVFGFDNFREGLYEYFYFPFAVLQSLSKDEIFDSIYKFQSNWLYMAMIILLTFSFSFFGKHLGSSIAKSTITKREIKLTF